MIGIGSTGAGSTGPGSTGSGSGFSGNGAGVVMNGCTIILVLVSSAGCVLVGGGLGIGSGGRGGSGANGGCEKSGGFVVLRATTLARTGSLLAVDVAVLFATTLPSRCVLLAFAHWDPLRLPVVIERFVSPKLVLVGNDNFPEWLTV